ncbi:MAG: recombination mediator RecR [Pseudomonadota bacterium]
MLGQDFEQIVKLLSKLPGVGSRSARRMMLHMLNNKDGVMLPLSDALRQAAETIESCEICHTLDTGSPCSLCRSPQRNRRAICVVETVADLWALERTGYFKGLYHVLGGSLSALDDIGPDDLHIPHLRQRIEQDGVEEVIIALNATIDGQTTAHYISEVISSTGVKITRLARGVPMGSALDYLDDNTLITAMNSRSAV